MNDYTEELGFWLRLESFIKDIQPNCCMGEEDKDMILHNCKLKILNLQHVSRSVEPVGREMEIKVKLEPIKIEGAKKINSLSDISDNSRLFYELGHYFVLRKYIDNEGNICEDKKWIREGIFKEIHNVMDFLKTDKRMSEKEFIEHHNFVVVD